MSEFDYDLYVIGGGSGGVRAARISGGYGARVGLCEESRLGGTCVMRGCIPKKLLVYASHYSASFAESAAYGWDVTVNGFDWSRLIANKDREITRLEGIYRRLLSDAGVDIHEGRGVVVDPHTVEVDGRRFTAQRILVAVGGWPNIPDFPGSEHTISSNEALNLPALPERVLVAGGGYIAVEFVGIFRGLGAQTTTMYRGPRILRGFDEDVRSAVEGGMRERGVDFVYDQIIESVEKTSDGLVVRYSGGDQGRFDQVLMAIGRAPKVAGLGLDEAGVEMSDGGAVIVDEFSRSSVAGIWAIGDVTNRINLTPVALMEGHAFADTEFGGTSRPVDHAFVPSAVFSQPAVGSVGYTEPRARAEFDEIRVYRSVFNPLKHTLTGHKDPMLMKLLVDGATDRVVGCHVVGDDAAEIVQGIAIAVKAGVTKAQFDATIGIHPTAAEELVTMRSPEPH